MSKVLKSTGNKIENLLTALFSFLFALVFLFNSPLHPWTLGEGAFRDSSVFKTIALMMENGYMPYKDTFDHKGPFLYILNFFGNKISYYRGILVIELIFIAVTFFMMYKIARLFCGKVSSVVSTLLAVTLLFSYFEGGNLAEEYAMPFIAIAIYIFLDYLKNKRINRFRMILSGVGLGAVLMLRPNMTAVWVVFCIYILFILLKKRKFRELINIVIFFAIGTAIATVPIIVWLASKNDLSYFWNDYIIFNRLYSSVEGGRALFSAKWSAFITFANTSVYIAGFFSLFYFLKNNKQRIIDIPYLIYLVITIILIVMSGMEYGHYGMVLVPAMVYPLCLLFSIIEKVEHETIRKALLMTVSLFSLSTLILPGWFELVKEVPLAYEIKHGINTEEEDDSEENIKSIIGCINQYTDENDSISVYGNYNLVYVKSKRKHATLYSYQDPIGWVNPEIMDDYFGQLHVEQPKVIVVQQEKYDDRIKSFLMLNAYKKVWAEEEQDEQSLSVYAKKTLM